MKEFYIVDRGEKINIIYDEYIEPKCILIHLHGLNSHFQPIYDCQNEFKYRIKYLQKAHISSYALEFIGHGKSGGEKGYIENFDIVITNILALLVYIEFKHPNIPIYILGESMGGAASIKLGIVSKKIKGIILLSPMCGIKNKISPVKINLLLKMSNYFPKWKLIGNKKKIPTCNNKEYNDNRKNSQFEYHGNIMLATARECYNTMMWINNHIDKFDKPVLAIHSNNDMITDIEATKNIINKCCSTDKEIFIVDSTTHRLLIPENNIDSLPDAILSRITNWINSRI